MVTTVWKIIWVRLQLLVTIKKKTDVCSYWRKVMHSPPNTSNTQKVHGKGIFLRLSYLSQKHLYIRFCLYKYNGVCLMCFRAILSCKACAFSVVLYDLVMSSTSKSCATQRSVDLTVVVTFTPNINRLIQSEYLHMLGVKLYTEYVREPDGSVDKL